MIILSGLLSRATIKCCFGVFHPLDDAHAGQTKKVEETSSTFQYAMNGSQNKLESLLYTEYPTTFYTF